MKQKIILFLAVTSMTFALKANENNEFKTVQTSDNQLRIYGEFMTDERFLLSKDYDWVWNENRLSLRFDKTGIQNTRFYSEVWLRNIGLPNLSRTAELYNKGIIDPYNLEIREAYIRISDFLTEGLDLRIGRQNIAWGTADKINPTSNLNPYDMEDVLDFGRQRGADAINLTYYFNNRFSLQTVFVPFFQPANLPIGVFSEVLHSTAMDLPDEIQIRNMSDNLITPKYNLGESSTAGLRFKGAVKGIDFSAGYVWGYDGLPFVVKNDIMPVSFLIDNTGNPVMLVDVSSELSYSRTHIIGADMATSIAGLGVWVEAAAFLPEKDVIMTNVFYPPPPLLPGVRKDKTTILEKNKAYIKYVIGCDYFFRDGSYLNFQYLHGFFHERGREELNDYFFVRYEKSFLNERLKISPLGGAFVITDFNDLKDNYAIVYIPQISYNPIADVEISLSAAIFEGKGENMFAHLKDYNMFMFRMNYHF